MSGKKNSNKPLENAFEHGLLKNLKKSEQKTTPDENASTEKIRVFHSGRPRESSLVKHQGNAPQRRPLANPESMPKPEVKQEQKAAPVAEKKQKVITPEKKRIIQEIKNASLPIPPVKKEKPKKAPPKPLTKEEKEKQIEASLDGMYDVYKDPEMAPEKEVAPKELWRYAVLFVCIFGFLTAGIFVFSKLFSYYRSYVVNTGLQELVAEADRFQSEYLKKSTGSILSLTPQDILSGKKEELTGGGTYTEKQQNLVNKLHQLKKINADTAGWITINGTVVNYPVVWTKVHNYYLRHDFYGKPLASGTLFIDERNSRNIAENRNTVIYGHNMSDGSMFASLHDFVSGTVFHRATIEIATEDGIYVYKPFSAHESDAYDNYFETDFESDEDFIAFCEQMAFLSPYQTNTKFDENTRILTLSTCKNEGGSRDRRYAVHAVLVQVIR